MLTSSPSLTSAAFFNLTSVSNICWYSSGSILANLSSRNHLKNASILSSKCSGVNLLAYKLNNSK